MAIHNEFCGDYILFSQTIGIFPKALYASSQLSFFQKVVVSLKKPKVSNFLVLTHSAKTDRSIINVSASNKFNLFQQPNKVINVSAINTFFPYQLPPPRLVKYQNVVQPLNFVQTVLSGYNKPASNVFLVTQTVNYSVNYIPSITQVFVMKSSVRVLTLRCDHYNIVLTVLNNEFTPIPSMC